MRLDRVGNAKRNVVYGMIEKITVIVLPFLVRTVLIKELGVEYTGLNSLFTSVLSVLSIAELGFGSAIIFSMYKPIAENDDKTICALLNFYKKVYRSIGWIVLLLGIAVIPFLNKMINGDVPDNVNIYVLYIIYLINTVITYWIFAYYNSLLSAFQRNDILSRVNIVISILMYGTQIGLIVTLHNYYLYVVAIPVFTLANNIRIAVMAKKIYPRFTCKGEISNEVLENIKKQTKGLLMAKLGGVSRSAFDSIFVSMFLGLTDVAMYNNYYYIVNSVSAILTLILSSITAGVGNSIAMETKAKNYDDMKKINYIYMILSGISCIMIYCLIQPFMEIWVGKELVLNDVIAVAFCLYFYFLRLGDINSTYMTAAGLFWEYRYCAMGQGIVNVALNFLLGKYMGILGIIMSTIISILLIDFAIGNRIVFRYYFKNKKEKEYYLLHILYFVVALIVAFCSKMIVLHIYIGGVLGLIVKAVVCLILCCMFYVLIYYRSPLYREAVEWLLEVMKIKSNIVRRILLRK